MAMASVITQSAADDDNDGFMDAEEVTFGSADPEHRCLVGS